MSFESLHGVMEDHLSRILADTLVAGVTDDDGVPVVVVPRWAYLVAKHLDGFDLHADGERFDSRTIAMTVDLLGEGGHEWGAFLFLRRFGHSGMWLELVQDLAREQSAQAW